MLIKLSLFLCIFICGEFLSNLLFFNYLKSYFKEIHQLPKKETKLFFLYQLSTFKGFFERFVITICLIIGFTPILAVFGALKIGTRFDKSDKIQNDYFLIGNFASILICVIYYFIFIKTLIYFS